MGYPGVILRNFYSCTLVLFSSIIEKLESLYGVEAPGDLHISLVR